MTGLLLQCLVGKTDRYHLMREDIEAIRMASGLHDIGKLQIPEEILTKPHSLTPKEYEIVKRHTQIGAKLITDLPIYQNERLVKYAIEICRWHHERWNGEGYPDGLKGDAIPIAAQVVSVADVYDALTSERCYKEAFSHEKSMRMIHSGECGIFNPLCLNAFMRSPCGGKGAVRRAVPWSSASASAPHSVRAATQCAQPAARATTGRCVWSSVKRKVYNRRYYGRAVV